MVDFCGLSQSRCADTSCVPHLCFPLGDICLDAGDWGGRYKDNPKSALFICFQKVNQLQILVHELLLATRDGGSPRNCC